MKEGLLEAFKDILKVQRYDLRKFTQMVRYKTITFDFDWMNY